MTEKSDIIAVTERLTLRQLHEDDLSDLARILGDPETMYAYEGAFSDAETRDWLDRMLRRYRDDGISLCAVILNATGEFIGQCGLTMQDIHGARVVEVGYLFRRGWSQGVGHLDGKHDQCNLSQGSRIIKSDFTTINYLHNYVSKYRLKL